MSCTEQTETEILTDHGSLGGRGPDKDQRTRSSTATLALRHHRPYDAACVVRPWFTTDCHFDRASTR